MEAEMKAMKVFGLAVALTASTAMGATVTYNISSSVAGQTIAAGTAVDWMVSLVASEGDNQGVATFVADVLVLGPGDVLINKTLGLAEWAYSFNYLGRGPGSLADSGRLGGLGMSGVLSTGTNATPGKLEGFGAGYAVPWNPVRLSGKNYIGDMVWGLGLESRKAALLFDPAGNYDVAGGVIDTAGLPDGWYTVKVIPGSTNILQMGLDLSQPLTGNFASPATGVGSEFRFYIPEPTTLLLLAGAGLLIRRRMA